MVFIYIDRVQSTMEKNHAQFCVLCKQKLMAVWRDFIQKSHRIAWRASKTNQGRWKAGKKKKKNTHNTTDILLERNYNNSRSWQKMITADRLGKPAHFCTKSSQDIFWELPSLTWKPVNIDGAIISRTAFLCKCPAAPWELFLVHTIAKKSTTMWKTGKKVHQRRCKTYPALQKGTLVKLVEEKLGSRPGLNTWAIFLKAEINQSDDLVSP